MLGHKWELINILREGHREEERVESRIRRGTGSRHT